MFQMSMLHSDIVRCLPAKHALQIQHTVKVLEWKHVSPETDTGSHGISSMPAADDVTNPSCNWDPGRANILPTTSEVVTPGEVAPHA